MSSIPDDSHFELPPASPHFRGPSHWRERAEEARVKADQLIDPEAKASMLKAVRFYEHLAEVVAQARR
jgi:hypothetical protein